MLPGGASRDRAHPLAVRETGPEGVIEVMSLTLRIIPMTRIALLGAVAGIVLMSQAVGLSSAEPLEPVALQAQAAAAAPRYVYTSGPQGFGYYTAPQVAAAPAPRPAAAPAPRSSVGPGVRNWSTGRRSPLHRPWMRP